jgi:AcrR family transcriptional regulator
MAVRKDGIESRKRLLEAAAEVFALKGYREATVAEICCRARSNIGAVNYHFGSKDELYIAVWKAAFEQALGVYPPDGGLGAEAKPEERLHALVHSLLHRIMDDGRLGYAGQILLREMADPSDAIAQVRHDAIRPLRERMRDIIKALLGPDATEQQLRFCQLSLIHQCLAIGFRKGKGHLPVLFPAQPLTKPLTDSLVEHITRFSLAGIAAVRAEIKSKKCQIC